MLSPRPRKVGIGANIPDGQSLADCARPAKHLEPLKGGKVPLEIFIRGKDVDQNTKIFQDVLDVVESEVEFPQAMI